MHQSESFSDSQFDSHTESRPEAQSTSRLESQSVLGSPTDPTPTAATEPPVQGAQTQDTQVQRGQAQGVQAQGAQAQGAVYPASERNFRLELQSEQHWDFLPRQRAWVEVDLDALAHNVRQIRGILAEGTDLLAVVKADAYGHGSIGVAQTVLQAGATWLGVATVTEGIELRRAGINAPILLLGAVHTPTEIQAIAQWQIQPTLCTPKQALIFSETLEGGEGRRPVGDQRALSVHLKLDTGMSRLGAPWTEAVEFVQWVQRLPHLKIASIYSHFATADELDQTMLWEQKRRFDQAVAELQALGICPSRLHLSNSAATLLDPGLHYDMVRVGLLLYGLYPAPHLQDQAFTPLDLRPVLQLKARVTQVKTIAAGMGVSYGYRFVAQKETRVATVAIGYADGVPRLLSNRMQGLLRGQTVPQVGSVTMDQLMLDVSGVDLVEPGDVVTLLGRSGSARIGAEDWAGTIGTIPWEILCGFKHRLPRVAVRSATSLERQVS
ncbi:MAG: alanine racemase [Prochlorothrix sp.]|nr:alanine racemase [Prochlorothrix sp.]